MRTGSLLISVELLVKLLERDALQILVLPVIWPRFSIGNVLSWISSWNLFHLQWKLTIKTHFPPDDCNYCDFLGLHVFVIGPACCTLWILGAFFTLTFFYGKGLQSSMSVCIHLWKYVSFLSFTLCHTEATDLLQNLSLDSQTKTLEAPEATKKVMMRSCSCLNDSFYKFVNYLLFPSKFVY